MTRVSNHISGVCLDVKAKPRTSRTENKAVLEGNGPIPQNISVFGELTMTEIYRVLAEELAKCFDIMTSYFD